MDTPEVAVQTEQSDIDDSSTLTKIDQMITENNFSEVSELISNRLAFLEARSKPITIGPFNEQIHRGYINSESEIRMGAFLKEFKPNDPELYHAGFEQMARLSEARPGSNTKNLAIIILPFLMNEYFGNIAPPQNESEIQEGNLDIITDSNEEEMANLSIRRLKKKGNSICIHQSTAAQEFLSLCGLDTTMVIGELEFGEGEKKPHERHAFNILQIKDKTWLLDVHNPALRKDRDSGINYVLSPGIYPISAEQKEEILRGGKVQVEHNDKYIENGHLSNVTSTRTYGGPVKNRKN